MLGGRVERDVRELDGYLYDESRGTGMGTVSLGLFGGLEEADRRYAEGRGGGRGRRDVSQEMAVCPVCGEFEGDEQAVAHHVEEHFGS